MLLPFDEVQSSPVHLDKCTPSHHDSRSYLTCAGPPDPPPMPCAAANILDNRSMMGDVFVCRVMGARGIRLQSQCELVSIVNSVDRMNSGER
jgi:hypothetical protein